MLEYRNAFENTGDSQKAAEGLFASKVLLVEGESESLILPFCFDRIGFDYDGKGISIVRCGGKNELDRFYRLYSEFGIPCFILFDGDFQNFQTEDQAHTIKANKSILSLFGCLDDFPDGNVHESYFGFRTLLEDNLGLNGIGSKRKAFGCSLGSRMPFPARKQLFRSGLKRLPTSLTVCLTRRAPS